MARIWRLPIIVVVVVALGALVACQLQGAGVIVVQRQLGAVTTAMVSDARTGRTFLLDGDAPRAAQRIRVFDARSGTLPRTIAGDAQFQALALDPGVDRVAALETGNGWANLLLLDARTGATIRAIAVNPASNALHADAVSHRILVTAEAVAGCPGQPPCSGVRIFDARTGAHLRTLIDPGAGLEAASDPRSGNIVVASSNGGSNAADFFAPSADEPRAHLALGRGAWLGQAMDETTGVRAVALQAIGPSFGMLPNRGQLLLIDTRRGMLLHRLALSSAPLAVESASGLSLLTVFGPAKTVSASPGSSGAIYLSPLGAGTLWVVDERRGTLLHTATVGMKPLALAVDPRSRRIYVGAAKTSGAGGMLSVVDEGSGQVVRTVDLPDPPTAITIDPILHRVFVLSAGEPGGTARQGGLLGWLHAHLGFIGGTGSGARPAGYLTILDAARL